MAAIFMIANMPFRVGYDSLFRHGRACHRKSGLPDLRHLLMRNSGKPELRAIHVFGDGGI
jgi:hypothetical protein